MAIEKATGAKESRPSRSQSGVDEEQGLPVDKDLQEMMKAGLHFGHKTSKTHPRMKAYISGVRNMVHIIDLKHTKEKLEEALSYIKELRESGKTILFVGTKVQVKTQVRELGERNKVPYVAERWIGGLFTNFDTIGKRVERLKELEEKVKTGELEKYTKKERLVLAKEQEKLESKFGGIKNMEKLPDAIFICDLKENQTAIREAKSKGIPIIAIVDTNTDPAQVQYPIPANDDAVSSTKYILEKVKKVLQ